MQPITQTDAIIDFCLEPLGLNPEATQETRRRLEHVIRTFQLKAQQPVPIDFSKMPSLVINEAAHGYE